MAFQFVEVDLMLNINMLAILEYLSYSENCQQELNHLSFFPYLWLRKFILILYKTKNEGDGFKNDWPLLAKSKLIAFLSWWSFKIFAIKQKYTLNLFEPFFFFIYFPHCFYGLKKYFKMKHLFDLKAYNLSIVSYGKQKLYRFSRFFSFSAMENWKLLQHA